MELVELDTPEPWPIHAYRADASENARHTVTRGTLLRKDGTKRRAGVAIRSIDVGGNRYFHATAQPSSAPRAIAGVPP